MSIYVKFGHIGGKHSDPIHCRTRLEAAVLAANIAFIHGEFGQEASNAKQWMLNNNTSRICWETAAKSFFIEVVKQSSDAPIKERH
jgi:acyl CoA:acetate/3-ketoacid CoA transferase alpha subunit